MAIVEFDVEEIKKHISLEKFERLIIRLGLESERKKGLEYVDVTADRPELLDFNMLMNAIFMLDGISRPSKSMYTINKKQIIEIKVDGSVKQIRPYITGIVVKNINLKGNTLKYLINFSEKLCDTYGRKRAKFAIGMHNLDVIKGNLIYEAVKNGEFIPLDSRVKMSFKKLLSSHKKGIEYGSTIKDNNYPILRDSEKVLSFIPIINSESTKVSENTKNIFVDITGTDKSVISRVVEIFNCIFKNMEADIYPIIVDYDKSKEEYPKADWKYVETNPEYINSIIGTSISKNEIIELAGRMGYVTSSENSGIKFMVPPYRTDVFSRRDIVEDIAIAYDYNKIKNKAVVGSFVGTLHQNSYVYDRISSFFIGCGYTEAMNKYLTNEQNQFENINREINPNIVKIDYSKTSSFTMLRRDILPLLLQDIGYSMTDSMPQRMFEYGKVFNMDKNKVCERDSVAFVSAHSKINFSEAKSLVMALNEYLKLDLIIKKYDDPAFIKGRCAAIYIKNKYIGIFGEIHPKVLDMFKIGEPVVAGELLIE